MDGCINKFTKTLGDKVNTIIITSPADGIIYSKDKDYTVVPRFVTEGDNEVIVIRHGKLMDIAVGEVVGVVQKRGRQKAGE